MVFLIDILRQTFLQLYKEKWEELSNYVLKVPTKADCLRILLTPIDNHRRNSNAEIHP